MVPKLHAAAGASALLIIASFWIATVSTLILGDKNLILMVKIIIAWSLCGLIPMLILAGASGARLARFMHGPLIATKQKRMKIIAFNGVVILVPASIALVPLAMQGQGGPFYWAIEIAELAAGATNVTLLGLNMRDGIRLSRRRIPAA